MPRPRTLLRRLGLTAVLAGLSLVLAAQGPERPPEFQAYSAAMAIQDPAARLKELERVKAAHPASPIARTLQASVAMTRATLAATLDEVVARQKEGLEGSSGMQRMSQYGLMATQLLDHPKAASFDKAKVLLAVQAYREQAQKDAADPTVLEAAGLGTRDLVPMAARGLDLQLARAQVLAGQPTQALATLDGYQKAGGASHATYFLVRGEVWEALNLTKEAFEAYLGAALENHKDGLRRAQAAYLKLNGKADGFEALLDARFKELPFHPTPYRPGADWKGKVQLVELFTGSECPPCAAADLALDGLLESHPATTIVLEYHLPIPAPDPMMNAATKRRQDHYGVNSTPTVMLEGLEKITGGGGRSAAIQKYKQLTGKLTEKVNEAPGATLTVQAALRADRVEAAFDLGKARDGVDYHLALVQGEQEHRGGNHILVHKMVVRDLITLDPTTAQAAFDLVASEKATDAYLTEFEQTSTRFKGYRFPIRRHAISRKGLKVVLFAQERATKKVLQAVLADVK